MTSMVGIGTEIHSISETKVDPPYILHHPLSSLLLLLPLRPSTKQGYKQDETEESKDI